ncbi:C40 family peptidase [Dickeya lacustris]|uniref:NlpC/P60 family protein n=1 Tax=Dickeya lacustris TaxID=2259638 RepID=A0ABY8G9A7_9GAMM|nr:C40 family peptidase [Dickeya lacustris]WFN56454.1 NlpC/P60 family protein [Dickeya lacustris]
MRLFITLFLLFFSNLFFSLAQAAPHNNAVLPRKSGVATASKAVDDPKKSKTAKSAKKSASAPSTPPASSRKAAVSDKHPVPKNTATSHSGAPAHSKTAAAKGNAPANTAHNAAKTGKNDKKPEKTPLAKAPLPTAKNAKKGHVPEQPATVAKAAHTKSTKPGTGQPAAKNHKGKSSTHSEELAASAHHGKNKKDTQNKSVIAMNPAHQKRYQHAKQTAMNKLMSQIGKPYHWGGSSPYSGFDCSGLVYYAYKDVVKIPIPRTANEMFHLRDAAPIKKNELESGDLVFFRITNRGAADHVGVYLGNGRFIQSPRTGSDIKISKLSEDYWQDHYVGARRVVTPKTIR